MLARFGLYRRETHRAFIVNRRGAVAQETGPPLGPHGLDFGDDRKRDLFGRLRADVYTDGAVQAREA